MFLNNKDSHNEIHHLNQATTLEISENSPLDAIFSKTGSETSSSFNPFNLSEMFKMKQHAKNAVALSLLSSLLMMGGTVEAAQNLKDIENNNFAANQSGFVYANNSRIHASGTVNKHDMTDLYSITDYGTPEGKMEWSILANRIVSMDVYKDVNKNKKLDAFDQYLFRVKDLYDVKTVKSTRDTMYIAKVWTNHLATDYKQHYQVGIGAIKTVKLHVIAAQNYGKFDNGRNNKPDFYVKTKILPQHYPKTSRVHPNDNTPFFAHFHNVKSYPELGKVPFEIELWDSDGRSKDDQADINPTRNVRKLSLEYDINKKQILKDGQVIGFPGRSITLKGDRKGDQAAISFVIR